MTSTPPHLPRLWHQKSGWKFFIGLIEAGSAIALCASIIGFLGKAFWVLDLFAHFRGQYFLALALALPLMVLAHRKTTTIMCLIGLLLNGFALWPLFQPRPSSEKIQISSPELTIVSHNLLFSNHQHTATISWLRSSQADILFLCEVTPEWTIALQQQLGDLYPHQHHHPRSDPFGAAILSRLPWQQIEEKQFGPFETPSLAATFAWNNTPILLLGMHPTPPNSLRAAHYRDQALAEAADWLVTQPTSPKIVLGDLNATRWSAAWRELTATASLRDSAEGFGWQPTWYCDSIFFQIPIDHVLISNQWIVNERWIGPNLGSDHRPVIARLHLAHF